MKLSGREKRVEARHNTRANNSEYAPTSFCFLLSPKNPNSTLNLYRFQNQMIVTKRMLKSSLGLLMKTEGNIKLTIWLVLHHVQI